MRNVAICGRTRNSTAAQPMMMQPARMTATSPLERSATSPPASAPNGIRPQYSSVNNDVRRQRLDERQARRPVDRKAALRDADGDGRDRQRSRQSDTDQPGTDQPHPDEDRAAMADTAHERFGGEPGEEAADPTTDVEQPDRPGVGPEVGDHDGQQERI